MLPETFFSILTLLHFEMKDMVADNTPRRGVPINVATSIDAVDTEYRQLGLLTSQRAKPKGECYL